MTPDISAPKQPRAWVTALWVALFTMPVWSSLLGRVVKGKWWLNDFDALLCGGDYMRRGLSPYELAPVCEGLRPAPFVYPPKVAEWLGALTTAFDFDTLRWAYVLLLTPLLAVTAWYMFRKVFPGLSLRWRVLGCAALTGSSLASGNIGLLLHGVILLCALGLHRTRWPFLIAVVLSAVIKPVLLTYLIVFLYQDRKLLTRAGFALVGAVAGLGLFVWAGGSGPLHDLWLASLDGIVLTQQPGISFFAWASVFGGQSSDLLWIGLLLGYMALMAAGGLVLAETTQMTGDERVLLGLGLAQLLNPRLMDYDIFVLAPFMALIVLKSQGIGATIHRRIRQGLWTAASITLFFSMADIDAVKAAPLGILLFSGLTLYVMARAALHHREAILTCLRSPRARLMDILSLRL